MVLFYDLRHKIYLMNTILAYFCCGEVPVPFNVCWLFPLDYDCLCMLEEALKGFKLEKHLCA